MRRCRLLVAPRLLVRTVFLAGYLVVLKPGAACAIGQEFIPLDHWCYPVVERFEALGLCVIPGDLPLTRAEMLELTSEIAKAGFDRRFSARDRYNLKRLAKEFTDFASQRDPQARYDPPTFFLEERPVVFEGDLDLDVSARNAFLNPDTEWFVESKPDVKIHLSENVTYDVRYRLLLGPEHGDRARNHKPSRRERSFKGLTSLYDRSYLIAGWKRVHVFAGRENVDWGPSDWGNLVVPGDRHSLDQIGARVKLKSLRLSMFHAQLSPRSRRFLSGHRLEIRFKRTTIGLNETVIYANKNFDPVYAFPLMSFYANQFNERGDDNVIWSADAKTSLLDALTLYGSFLIDDFQFERDGVSPDKIAFDIGGRFAVSSPYPVTLRARYRYVDIFTFTHRDSGTAYVSGEGLLEQGDALLGGAPGPDTDSWRVEGETYPLDKVVATVAVFGERRGEGNDFRVHVPPADAYPAFPSGNVQRTLGFGIQLKAELRRNSTVMGYFSRISIHNRANVRGLDATSDGFHLAVKWDF